MQNAEGSMSMANAMKMLKCCNCGGEHSAAFAACVVQRQAKEVQRIKTINKVSYAEALNPLMQVNASKQGQMGQYKTPVKMILRVTLCPRGQA